MRFLGNEQVFLHVVPRCREFLHLFAEEHRIQHYAVTDEVGLSALEDTGRNAPKHIFLAVEFQSVSGIRTALKTRHYVIFRGQNIDHLAFALVAPLKS